MDADTVDMTPSDVVVVSVPDTIADAEALLDDAWVALSEATRRVVEATSATMLTYVADYREDVTEVWVRMDTSHEPAHGHVDALFTSDGVNILAEVSEEAWLIELEEYAWDLGHIAASHFVRDADGVRRLKIEASHPGE